MHQLRVSVFIVACLVTHAAAAAEHEFFSTKTVEFGAVAVNSCQEMSVPFQNVLNEELSVHSVRVSMGPYTSTIADRIVKPGESGTIQVKLNTQVFRGQKNNTLTVVFDQPYYTEKQLRLKAYIRSDVVVEPGKLDFGSFAHGKNVSQSIKVNYQGRDDWKIKQVTASSDLLRPKLEEIHRKDGNVQYMIHCKLSPKAPRGNLIEELLLVTNDARFSELKIAATATIEPKSIDIKSVTPSP